MVAGNESMSMPNNPAVSILRMEFLLGFARNGPPDLGGHPDKGFAESSPAACSLSNHPEKSATKVRRPHIGVHSGVLNFPEA
jgi:hypothetical protein